jgi:DNA gyrase/topoisomerase IV subunit A
LSDPAAVLEQLKNKTKTVQSTFNANMVALDNGTPRSLTLRDFLVLWLEFRCDP